MMIGVEASIIKLERGWSCHWGSCTSDDARNRVRIGLLPVVWLCDKHLKELHQ